MESSLLTFLGDWMGHLCVPGLVAEFKQHAVSPSLEDVFSIQYTGGQAAPLLICCSFKWLVNFQQVQSFQYVRVLSPSIIHVG